MPDPNISIFGAGQVISELRDDSGLNVSELGRKIGVSRSMMSRFESNERALTIKVLRKIAVVLDVPAEQLILSCIQVAQPELMQTRIGTNMRRIVDAIVALDESERTGVE